MKNIMKAMAHALTATTIVAVALVAINIDQQAAANTSFEPPMVEVTTSRSALVAKRPQPRPEIMPSIDPKELACLQENIYFEAGTESIAGKIAVALVTLNRVQDNRYPDTICKVVKQGPVRESWKTAQYPDLPDSERIYHPIRNRCQFSWYCDGKPDEPFQGIGWQQSQDVAYRVAVLGMYRGMIEGATHYHATYVSPEWRKAFTLVGKIDEHIFYRWEQ